MARPKKNNLDFYRHDRTMRNDEKILALRNRFEHVGYSVYNMLLESLCEKDNLEIPYSNAKIELLAGDFRVHPEKLTEILTWMSSKDIDLIQIKDGFIRCSQLEDRHADVFDGRNKKRKNSVIPGETGVSPSITRKNSVIPGETGVSFARKGEDSKGEDSKEEYNTPPKSPGESENLFHFELFWRAYPKKERKNLAREKFIQLIKDNIASPYQLLSKAQEYFAYCIVKFPDDYAENQFVKFPENWLKDNGWLNDWKSEISKLTIAGKVENGKTNFLE